MGVRQYADAIASIESAGSGDYSAVGPLTKKGNRAYGRYQVMDFNIGPWTEKYLGQRLTPQQFLSSPEAQDKVFEGEFGGYVERYGNPQDAASMWFTGKPMSQGAGRSDILGTTGAGYVQKFNSALGSPQGGKPMATGLLGNPTVSTQGQAPEQPKSIWGNQDMWDKLTIAFNSMRMRPDQGLAQAAQGRISERAKSAKAESQRNATADWLESQGAAELAAGVRSGAVPANAALQMAMEKPKAQSPYSSIGKLQADLAAGRINQEQYDVALQNMAPSGMTIESTPDGGFRMVQGVGASVKLTEGQGKATGFYNRAEKSDKILSDLERAGTNLYESIVENVPLAGNYMVSEEYQKYSQAKRDFINAILRQESGAVIGPSEFANAEKQYFPQPGDGPDVIKQKRQNRMSAIEGLKVASGPGAAQLGRPDQNNAGDGFSVTGRID